MKSKLVGLGLGLAALSTLGVVAVPAVAYADASTGNTTCYPGCSSATSSPPTTQTVVVTPTEPAKQAAASGGLAFTGADIEGMAAIGAGALVVGGALVRRSRRQRQVQANA
jgi:hypothetical protein